MLGARHSTIKLHASRGARRVPAKVYTVEPTGDVTFVQCSARIAIVNISLPPTCRVEPDEQVWLEFDQERCTCSMARPNGVAGGLTWSVTRPDHRLIRKWPS